ncbi:hypothetical protein ACPPVW_02980 [Leifsonia sp. McL0607]|uniref:hypothetical protein n=1 Tax=Leifsonia sp. McL0607 TaxID=3415672 RepID=UPI003CEA7192
MNDIAATETATGTTTTPNSALRRRTIIGAAAWAAPAVAAAVASPAYAASTRKVTLSLVAPSTGRVGTLAPDAVYATVLADGVLAEGVTVTFSVANAALAGFGADGDQSVMVVSDAAGRAYPPAMLLRAQGLVQITATANGSTAMAYIAVSAVVVTAGTIAFKQSAVNVAAASTFALPGALTRTAGTGYPAAVSLVYPVGFSGPATVPVNQATGEFIVSGVTAGTVAGSIGASATGFGSTTVAITLVLGYISTPQAMYGAAPGLAAPNGKYVISGVVNRVVPGAALPATVTVSWFNTNPAHHYENATGLASGQTVTVNQTTGAFTLPTLTPIDTGRLVEGVAGVGMIGQIQISAPDYLPTELALSNSSTAASVNLSNRVSTEPASIKFAPGETRNVAGHALVENSLYTVNYPEGFTGPATVISDANAAYTIPGVKSPTYITRGDIVLSSADRAGAFSSGMLLVL